MKMNILVRNCFAQGLILNRQMAQSSHYNKFVYTEVNKMQDNGASQRGKRHAGGKQQLLSET